MRFIHRVSFYATDAMRERLHALGVKVPPGIVMPGGGDPLVAFDLAEDHPNWQALRELFTRWDAFGMQRTEFTEGEVAAARWLEPQIGWHHGYPQPRELDFGYREATYDLSDYCERCGIGLRQKAPFQMKGEPKWGKRSILQLNWVFDEYFVTPDVWAAVFQPHGVGCMPVLNTRLAELKTVVQLVVEEEVTVVTDGLATEEAACPACGRTKYLPVARGPFPPLVSEPSGSMAKTREYFGSGASANKGVVVSQALSRDMVARNVQGASFRPVAGGLGTATA